MALKEIKIYPDPALREVAVLVDGITDEIVRLSEDMIETMQLANGIGLAANQVGVSMRMITVDRIMNKKHDPIALINPEILLTESEDAVEEGCLSLPKFYEFVKRAKKVRVRALNVKGKMIEIDCEDQLARALQHEIDHLNGILFIDHLSPLKKEFFKKKYMRIKK
ncbi:MAG: peptide deformylase [Syntrophobacterales bacterium]|jgi:peptide deformylase|nr:peptide deformylase [Syntrophobacterales bacterium]